MRKFLIITRNYVIIMRKYLREIMAKWLESWTRNRKVASSNLGLAGIAGGGSECTASKQGTEPPTAPGRRSINGCPLLCALWMGKCRARIPSMGHHTWPYVTSL